MSKLKTVDVTKANKRSAKYDTRKDELACFAIEVLKERGYANTRLRDIAKYSSMSLGMLHYYFEDKVELISYCVQKYKQDFIHQMDKILQASDSSSKVIHEFSKGLSLTILSNAEKHRLWYDIRSQAMFDIKFQKVVLEIDEALVKLIKRLIIELGGSAHFALPVYMHLDGVCRYFMQQQLAGNISVSNELSSYIEEYLESLVVQTNK